MNITAAVDFHFVDEDPNGAERGAEVLVTAPNMSTEMATEIAKWAVCRETGMDSESFGYSYLEADTDVTIEPGFAVVRFLAA